MLAGTYDSHRERQHQRIRYAVDTLFDERGIDRLPIRLCARKQAIGRHPHNPGAASDNSSRYLRRDAFRTGASPSAGRRFVR